MKPARPIAGPLVRYLFRHRPGPTLAAVAILIAALCAAVKALFDWIATWGLL